MTRNPTALQVALRSALVVVGGTVGVGAIVGQLVRAGFLGISNDDAARTLIAWSFACAPSIDPTRSSWLPVPTYILGSFLRLWPNLALAPRLLSAAAAVAGVWAAHEAARALRAGSAAAAAATVVAFTYPWAVFSMWASGVPEMPCAAFFLAGSVLLMGGRAQRRSAARSVVGAALIALSCGHRYEAWFAASGLAVALAFVQPFSRRRVGFAVSILLASVPLAWLAINVHRSGDAFDFVHRVVAFRGSQSHAGSPTERLLRFPTMLLRDAGVLATLAVGALVVDRRGALMWLLPAAAAMLGVTLAEVRGGGATHHAARALLLTVVLMAPPAALALQALWQRGSRTRLLAAVVTAAGVAQSIHGSAAIPREIDPATVEAGQAVQRHAHGDCYFVELERQDFLWLEVGSGTPGQARPDRAYGGTAPPDADVVNGAERCRAAVVSSPRFVALLQGARWYVVERHGPWSLLAREAR